MRRKNTIILLIAFFLCLAPSEIFPYNIQSYGKLHPSSPVPYQITRESLDRAFKQKRGILAALTKLVQPNIPILQEKLMGFGICNLMGRTKNWMEWRNSQDLCGSSHKTPDGFRRSVVKELEDMAAQILEKTGSIPSSVSRNGHDAHKTKSFISWLAIGTPGPNSDIDTVAQEALSPNQASEFLPKIVAEVRAKALFDALGIALYGQTTGVAFDTESYIDVTDDLNKESYMKRIQSPFYQNLAITLAFAQVVRQLRSGVSLRHPKSHFSLYGYQDFHTLFLQSKFLPLLDDADGFSKTTHPAPDPKQNIETYLPIINDLAVKAATLPDNLERAKLKGVLGTYFPESYFTREALAHVCYSDDRYSQLLLALISQHRQNNAPKESSGDIPPHMVEGFKNQTITPTPFIYTVSALENLGYFFHKLDQQDRPYEALKNAAKYFFRIARALAGYWGIKEEDVDSSDETSQEVEYVKNLYRLSSQLERLKRGFLPFSSPGYIESLIRNVNQPLGNDRIKGHANAIYALYHNIYISPEMKRRKLEEVAKDFHGLIYYDLHSKRFDLNESAKIAPAMSNPSKVHQNRLSLEKLQKINQAVQNKVNSYILELVSLMNLVIGADSDPKNITLQKIRRDSDLQRFPTPIWNAQRFNPIGNLTDMDFKLFLNGLVLFMKHTLEDFAQKNHRELQPVGLNSFAQQHIAAAIGSRPMQPSHTRKPPK